MTFWPLIYYNVRVYWKYCRLLISIPFLFTLKASVWKSYFRLTSCNYMFTLCLRVWSMCCPSPNLLERLLICIVSRAVSVQVTPMGVSLWSHISHPSSNSSSVRERDLSFGCLLPFAFSGAKLSSDLLWNFLRPAQSPGLPNYWMEGAAR